MNYPQILHHGAIAGVTGLCHQLQMDVRHVLLVDCGLFQGVEVSPDGGVRSGSLAIDFPLAGISALEAIYVHVDHVGCISWLLAAGFKGSILCSELAAKLLPVVLGDAFQLVFSRDQQQVERYLKLLESRIIALAYDSWFTLEGIAQLKAAIRLQRAGHTLGSTYVDIGLLYKYSGTSKRIVFSAELGALHSPLLPAPKAPERADILAIESTSGDRRHEDRRSRRQRLGCVIERALAGNGMVLIPTFSIGRAQELLCELEDIIHNHPALAGRSAGGAGGERPPVDWHNLLITLDSPLVSCFTQVYRELEPFWRLEALARVRGGCNPLSFASLLTFGSDKAHLAMVRRLADTAQPAIVYCRGWHVPRRAYRRLPQSRAARPAARRTVRRLSGSGHSGARHSSLWSGGGYVELDESSYKVGAKISTVGGYSAHADKQGLVNFVTQMREWSSEIRIVLGDSVAKNTLAAQYQTQYRQANRHVEVKTPGGFGNPGLQVAGR